MVYCPDCGESFDSESGLRTHARFSSDHDESEVMNTVSGDSGSSEEPVDEDDSGSKAKDILVDKAGSGGSSEDNDMEAQNSVNLSEELDSLSGGSDSSDSDSSDSGSEEDSDDGDDLEFTQGIDDVVNKVYGHVLTWDMDADDPERDETQKKMKQIAEDVELGQNAKVVWKKWLESQGEMTPEQALIMSTVLALALGLVERPDAGKKAWDWATSEKEDSDDGQEQPGEEDEE